MCSPCAWLCAKWFVCVIATKLHNVPGGRYYLHPNSVVEETEAWGGLVRCSRSHSQLASLQRLKSQPDPIGPGLNHSAVLLLKAGILAVVEWRGNLGLCVISKIQFIC